MSKIYFEFWLPWRPRKRFRKWKRQQTRSWNIRRNLTRQRMKGTGIIAQLDRMPVPNQTPLDLQEFLEKMYAIKTERNS